MRGLAILGATLDAGETLVAAAACAALRAAGSEPSAYAPVSFDPAAAALAALAEITGQAEADIAPRRLGAPASPLVAAALAGRELDPGELLGGAAGAARGDVLVAVLSGGLLAPLTERYVVRDLAREFGAPVVVAVRAGPDAAGTARLTLEAARAAGLSVAAVVLTGWPDSPDLALQEERRLLAGLLAPPLAVLGAGLTLRPEELAAAAAHWPVEAWLEPAATAASPAQAHAPAQAAHAQIVLEPYDEWEQRPTGDPRSTPRPALMAALLEIVAAEGPMTASRAYALCNRASGGRKLTSAVTGPLTSAMYWLAQERKVVLTRAADVPWQGDDLVRAPDAPAVLVREIGPRALEEVPLDEVAALVARVRAARGTTDVTELKRAVLSLYGLVRLTARADEYLGLAVELADP